MCKGRLVLLSLVCAVAQANTAPVFPCGAPGACTIAQVTADTSGNSYVIGSRGSPSEAIVAKLSPQGDLLFFTAFNGAHGSSYGNAIALDSAGNIYIGGYTSAPDFPLRSAVQTTIPTGGNSGFVLKLAPDGSQVIYSTFLGGTKIPQGRIPGIAGAFAVKGSAVNAVAVDGAGNAYVTGATLTPDFPVTQGMPAGAVGDGFTDQVGAFITKLGATGDRLLYSGIISGKAKACNGGSSCTLSAGITGGSAIAVDSAGRAFVAGNSNVTDLPVTQDAYRSNGIGVWVARVAASGDQLEYLTYLTAQYNFPDPNGPADATASGIAVDSSGNVYVAGTTSNPLFPTTAGAFQRKLNTTGSTDYQAPSDGFAVKLNSAGSALVYATLIGGLGSDSANAIAIDGVGNTYLAGTTGSSVFPVTTGAISGGDFIVVLNSDGTALNYASRFPTAGISTAMALDRAGNVHLAGAYGSVSSFTPGAASAAPFLMAVTNAASAAFKVTATTASGQPLTFSIVAPGEVISLYGNDLGPANGVSAQADASGKLPVSVAGTEVLLNGVPLPLLYVSQGQVNAVTPFAMAVPSIAVKTQNGSSTLNSAAVANDPAIFLIDGYAAAVNEDGTINSALHPAPEGSIVAVWVTGLGIVEPTPEDGVIANAPQPYTCCWDPPASLGVVYQGAAPGMVTGVAQVNVRVPAALGVGVSTAGISIAGSPAATIYVSP